ncbi:PepSY-associated TM helix domain-containing protein [Nostoc sp.]|uniref:PepSY-associated TM helix domain-containing protein n=1 Tax=Nostoc sp. TaxID=1180 RepID=UPI002FF9883E
MKSKTFRHWIFLLHRYLGLAVGFVIVLVGLTGSLLVFQPEFEQWSLQQKIGTVIPQSQRISAESAIDAVKEAYQNKGFTPFFVGLPDHADQPYDISLENQAGDRAHAYVNPYTGKVMWLQEQSNSFFDLVRTFHYSLLADEPGRQFIGVIAFLMMLLSISGTLLWSGWRKLITGFKIKLDAHPKRVNYDVHKVAGIVAAVFLFFTAITGFCWNFWDYTVPAIYALTLTPQQPTFVSQPLPGKTSLSLSEILLKADAALPKATTTYIRIPKASEEVFEIGKKLPQETDEYGDSSVTFDQYTGQVLQVRNALKLPLGDRIVNGMTPLHYGTFGGLPTRILYVFVGVAPLILFITAFVMWRYRKRPMTSLLTQANAQK